MHTTRFIRSLLFIALSLLVAGSLYAEPADTVDLAIDPVVWDKAGNGMDQTVQLSTYEVALGDYCDTGPNYGTTASCEAGLVVPAGTCPNGVASKGCRKVGNACASGGSPGKWCQRCYVKCRNRTCAIDGEPVDGDADGVIGNCDDADVVPINP